MNKFMDGFQFLLKWTCLISISIFVKMSAVEHEVCMPKQHCDAASDCLSVVHLIGIDQSEKLYYAGKDTICSIDLPKNL